MRTDKQSDEAEKVIRLLEELGSKEREDTKESIEEKESSADGDEEEEEEEEGWSFSMAIRFPKGSEKEDEDEKEEEEEDEEEKEKEEKEEQGYIVPTRETQVSLGDEWYLDRLKDKDKELFSYTDASKPYSRICQASAGKQSNVMDFATYKRARLYYRSDVFWLEAPLSSNDIFLLHFVSKSLEERIKFAKGLSEREMINLEKQGLRLGFPLKDNKSILEKLKRTNPSKVDPVDQAEMDELIKVQNQKPLWTVVRAGSESDRPNYYICAELWCIKDNLPIIPAEFEGTVSRQRGKDKKVLKKQANSCPICGGTILINIESPKPGETVVQRKQIGTSKIQKYAGFMPRAVHPKGYALPCCFTNPNNQDVPKEAIAPPKKILIDIGEDDEKEKENDEADTAILDKKLIPVGDKENRNRPFSPYKRGSTTKNDSYIPNQYIRGRILDRWVFLDKATVGVPSKAVNTLLGQDPKQFLSEKGGVKQGSINTQLKYPAQAFIQYGIGNSKVYPGTNLISLLAYAKYATEYTLHQNDSLSIESNESIIEHMFEDKGGIEMFHAFQTANYGTLVHEFSTPEKSQDVLTLDFQSWYKSVAWKVSASQRAYFINLYHSYNTFKQYVLDKDEPKDLRLWESLFAQPGLLTKTGFILVKIIVPKDPADEARLECPDFGLSVYNQQIKPPLLFILQDAVTGSYDPLVLYDGVSKDEKRVLGVIQDSMPLFGKLTQSIQESLKDFFTQYFLPNDGCGRTAQPVHPWIPVKDTTRVPKLSTIFHRCDSLNLVVEALMRDRSNRLVGIILKHKLQKDIQIPFYIPCIDDGILLPGIPSVYGEEDIPLPPIKDILELLIGKQIKISENKLASNANFPGLMPMRFIANEKNIVGVELLCGATVPCLPFPISAQFDKAETHRRLPDLLKGIQIREDMPWETDISILGNISEGSETLGQTNEEALNESYQHLRISVSNWLNDTPRGRKVRDQIELLRQARKRLPLFELQKRLDILVTPIVHSFLTEKGESKSFVLRRDCLQIEKEDACIGGCTWSEGRCLIHTTKTARYVDPLRVLTARLVDELLRTFGLAMEILNQHVSYLKPMTKGEVLSEDSTILFSAFGRGDEALYNKLGYSQRRPGSYSQGLTYPEEVSISEQRKTIQNIPDDWNVANPVYSSDIMRDKYNLLRTTLIEITGKSIFEIEKATGPFSGTIQNWQRFAKTFLVNILFTELRMYSYVLSDMIDTESKNYIILNKDGIPFVNTETRKFKFVQKDLPVSIQIWIQKNKTKAEINIELSECATILKLDQTIGNLYEERLGDEIVRTRNVGQNLAQFGYPQCERMFSSATGWDCFVHSFLTSVSENFRRLLQGDKDAFANYFRRTLYPQILDVLKVPTERKERIMRRVMPKEFLDDEDVDFFCQYFKVNIISFEDEKSYPFTELKGKEGLRKRELITQHVGMPKCIMLYEANPGLNKAYMIYNNGGHFESVRNTVDSLYSMSLSEAKATYDKSPCTSGLNEQSFECSFNEGDMVLYKGKEHYIIWRKSDSEGSCIMYGLTTSEQGKDEYLQLSRKERDFTSNEKKYGPIEAPASEVYATEKQKQKPNTTNTTEKKPCKEGKVRDPISKRCIKAIQTEKVDANTKPCKEGKVRDPVTNRCKTQKTEKTKKVKKAEKAEKAGKTVKADKPCKEGKVRDPISGRCKKQKGGWIFF